MLADGRRLAADVPHGQPLMEAAVHLGVPGILGTCWGAMSCTSCAVRPEGASLPPPHPFEMALLDAPGLRLSCQILAGPETDGLVLHVPR